MEEVSHPNCHKKCTHTSLQQSSSSSEVCALIWWESLWGWFLPNTQNTSPQSPPPPPPHLLRLCMNGKRGLLLIVTSHLFVTRFHLNSWLEFPSLRHMLPARMASNYLRRNLRKERVYWNKWVSSSSSSALLSLSLSLSAHWTSPQSQSQSAVVESFCEQIHWARPRNNSFFLCSGHQFHRWSVPHPLIHLTDSLTHSITHDLMPQSPVEMN